MGDEPLKKINGYPFRPYHPEALSNEESLQKAKAFFERATQRRSVRDFSSEPVPKETLEWIIRTAGTSPSGAHKQPWTFCVVSNPGIKKEIREAAEKEEYESYHGRMNDKWLRDLKPFGTDWHKPFLETAPYLIVVFKRVFEMDEDGGKLQNYYVNESVGLACGMLLMAIHEAGLVSLTHTPSPMNFLAEILQRSENERPFLLIPVGKAAEECWVPDQDRKPLDEISFWYE